MKHRLVIWISALTVLGLVLSACGTQPQTAAPAQPTEPPAATQAPASPPCYTNGMTLMGR